MSGGRVVPSGGSARPPRSSPFYDKGRRGDSNNFGPRLGFVFNPGRRRTADDPGRLRRLLQPLPGERIAARRAEPGRPAGGDPEPRVTPTPTRDRTRSRWPRSQRNYSIQGIDNRTPYTQQFSVGWSIQLGDDPQHQPRRDRRQRLQPAHPDRLQLSGDRGGCRRRRPPLRRHRPGDRRDDGRGKWSTGPSPPG